jgi:hypothetical protein
MKTLTQVLTLSMAFILCLSSVPTWAQSHNEAIYYLKNLVPEIPGVSESDIMETSANLPQELEAIAKNQTYEMNAAPDWVKELRSRSVGSYFPRGAEAKSLEWQEGSRRLTADATRLHLYFEERDDSKLFKDFIGKKLEPFVNKITPKTIASAYRHSKVTQPISQWTVETLVVTQQVGYVGRLPNFLKNSMSLLNGKHLKGASVAAGVLVVGAAVAYAGSKFGFGAGVIVGGMLSGVTSVLGSAGRSFEAGPLAEIWKAATGWFLTPTTEFVRVLNARYFGKAEEKVNHMYDKLKPKSEGKEAASIQAAAERNQIPKMASIADDKTSLAGMTPDQQERNWNKCLRMWVAVAKRFGQLLRDTHHHGRVLMLISAHDEQAASMVVETIDTKLLNLALQAEAILEPYKTRIIVRASDNDEKMRERLQALEVTFDEYQLSHERQWREPWLEKAEINKILAQTAQLKATLMTFGLTSRDLDKLEVIQAERAKSVEALVTALALNDVRSFMTAEANRNLDPEARIFTRTVREGFTLEAMTQRYLGLVQHKIRLMGFEVGLTSGSGARCEGLF